MLLAKSGKFAFKRIDARLICLLVLVEFLWHQVLGCFPALRCGGACSVLTGVSRKVAGGSAGIFITGHGRFILHVI